MALVVAPRGHLPLGGKRPRTPFSPHPSYPPRTTSGGREARQKRAPAMPLPEQQERPDNRSSARAPRDASADIASSMPR